MLTYASLRSWFGRYNSGRKYRMSFTYNVYKSKNNKKPDDQRSRSVDFARGLGRSSLESESIFSFAAKWGRDTTKPK
ncbi:hypothetical protein GCM10007111_15190 [Virgibacillus kapii]|uniref:AP2-like integrase N-terminal domain-containing protein n=1 Tax=Virgibacillus kapii TaxID=1638645 RepID=A0ABQ2DCU3_9BACI|nr:hypothetical protein GCM10007111_15190 [Virgibacillus kapii]